MSLIKILEDISGRGVFINVDKVTTLMGERPGFTEITFDNKNSVVLKGDPDDVAQMLNNAVPEQSRGPCT